MSAAPNGKKGGRKMERTLATDRCMLPTLQIKDGGQSLIIQGLKHGWDNGLYVDINYNYLTRGS